MSKLAAVPEHHACDGGNAQQQQAACDDGSPKIQTLSAGNKGPTNAAKPFRRQLSKQMSASVRKMTPADLPTTRSAASNNICTACLQPLTASAWRVATKHAVATTMYIGWHLQHHLMQQQTCMPYVALPFSKSHALCRLCTIKLSTCHDCYGAQTNFYKLTATRQVSDV